MHKKIKLMLCALLLLGSISLGAGPRNQFFTTHQVHWMGANQFSYAELYTGVSQFISLRFKNIDSGLGKEIVEASIAKRLDPLWVTAIVWTESSFNSRAKSHKGARGLMQLMPGTAKEVLEEIHGIDLPHWLDIKGNLRLGSFYLKKLLRRFQGDHKLATMAYNLGSAGLRRRIQKSGVPKMKYWSNVLKRYQLLIYQVQKSKQMAKADSVKFL